MKDLTSWLRPVDFDLIMDQKKYYQTIYDELKLRYKALQNDARMVFIKTKTLLLSETITKLDDIKERATLDIQRIIELKCQEEVSRKVVEELKRSINDLNELITTYEAPDKFDYIEKISLRVKITFA